MLCDTVIELEEQFRIIQVSDTSQLRIADVMLNAYIQFAIVVTIGFLFFTTSITGWFCLRQYV